MPTPRELNLFHQLQKLFSSPSILHHHDGNRVLYVDLDASKEFGFGAHIYHSTEESSDPPKQKSQQSILFLRRLLTDAETRYWPTELEIAGIVWVVMKIRHMIEASAHCTVVYTDHSAAVSIVRQTSLNTTSTEKLNLRLIRASEYSQRFRLDVRYKPGKSASIQWASETKTLLTKNLTNCTPRVESRLTNVRYDQTYRLAASKSTQGCSKPEVLMRKCPENIDGESSSRLAEYQGPLCREKGSRVNVLYPTPEDKIKIVPTTETLLEEARLAQESSERTAQTPAAKAQLALTGQAIMEGEALRVAEKVTDEGRRVFWEFQR